MKKLIVLILVMLLSGTISALPSVGTLVVNDTDGVMSYDLTYQFNSTVSGVSNETWHNITACSINSVSMTGPGGNGTGLWQVNTTLNTFSMASNCTYTNVTVTCIYNTFSSINVANASWTLIPCVESCNTTLTSASATVDTLSTVVSDRISSSSVIWMIPQTYNTSHGQCNFNVSNTEKVTISSATVNITAAVPYCVLTVLRDSTDTGTMVVQVSSTLDITQPSSIPAAAIGALTVIVILSHIIATRTST